MRSPGVIPSRDGGRAQARLSRAMRPSANARSATALASPSVSTIGTEVCSLRGSAASGASASTAPGR